MPEPRDASATVRAFVYIHGVPVFFREDWRTGIGGGLWSTGLALAYYFGTEEAAISLRNLADRTDKRGPSILELGSGNGFLAVALSALAAAKSICVKELVVSDMEDHLNMIRETLSANHGAMNTVSKVAVMEHQWGNFENSDDPMDSLSSETEKSVRLGTAKFDLIVGSDVAYRDYLYEPLIRSIKQFSHAKTVSLIGVSMSDTTPDFFRRLHDAGLVYQKFADHLLAPEFRGVTFGLFVVQLMPKDQ